MIDDDGEADADNYDDDIDVVDDDYDYDESNDDFIGDDNRMLRTSLSHRIQLANIHILTCRNKQM